MGGQLSITARDLRRLRALTDPAQLEQGAEPLPWSLLQGLADLIGCDNVAYESHDLVRQAVHRHQRLITVPGAENFVDDAVQNSFWHLYHRGLCDYWPRTGDYSSIRRMLANPQWPGWGDTAYAEWVRSLGVRGQITIALPPEGGVEHRLNLWRYSAHDFTEQDTLLLGLLRPHIVALHRRPPQSANAPPVLTPRQREVVRLMAAGMTNHQIASRLSISEGTVRTHCDNIYHRLNVDNRVTAVAVSQALPGNR